MLSFLEITPILAFPLKRGRNLAKRLVSRLAFFVCSDPS